MIVVGAGVFGLAVARAAALRGLAVTVVDQASPGAGASGGVVGALSPHVPDNWNPKKEFQLKSLLMARDYWTGVEAESGEPTGYRALGRLLPLRGPEAEALAAARAEQAATLWQGRAAWRVVPADSAPWVSAGEDVSAMVHETLSAQLFPRRACHALTLAAARAGATIRPQTGVSAVEPGRVVTADGALHAPRIVLAAGLGGLELLGQRLGRTLGSGVKGQAALLRATLPDAAPILFDDGVYVIAHGPESVAVGSTSEPAYGQGEGTDAQLDHLMETAGRLVPDLRAAPVLERWAAVRPKARRRDPMLGSVPGCDGVFAALGGFKIGFGLAPLVGEVMADMLQGAGADIPDSFTVAHHLQGAPAYPA